MEATGEDGPMSPAREMCPVVDCQRRDAEAGAEFLSGVAPGLSYA